MSITDMMKLQSVGGTKPLTSGEQGAPLPRADTAREPASQSGPIGGIAVEVTHTVEAGKPPVEADRVAKIRSALQEGRYPIVPAETADAMIAARLSLTVPS